MADQHGTTTIEVPEVAQSFIGDLEKRMEELRPQVTEFNTLNEMRSRVLGIDQHPPLARTQRRGGGRRRGGEPTARDNFLRVVGEHPEGVTVSEVAQELETQPNYLYRVASDLVKEGAIEKKESKYFLASAEPASPSGSRSRSRRSSS